MRFRIVTVILFLAGLAAFSPEAAAQFKKEAFQQDYSDTSDPADTAAAPLFSFKEYVGGLAHKNSLKIGTNFGASAIVIGGQQIYEKKYWKLPIIYGGIGAGVGMGLHYKNEGNKTMQNVMFATAGAVYWGSLMDGVINYSKDDYPNPGKSTIYSILLPGLGQIYNKEYWKVAVYWGGLLGAYHFYDLNSTNYKRYQRIFNEASEPGYTGTIPAKTAQYYRDIYRRYRDYSILAVAAFYLIQVIDANVFAYMQDFEVNDDLTMNVSPTILAPDTQFAYHPTGVGLRIGFTF